MGKRFFKLSFRQPVLAFLRCLQLTFSFWIFTECQRAQGLRFGFGNEHGADSSHFVEGPSRDSAACHCSFNKKPGRSGPGWENDKDYEERG